MQELLAAMTRKRARWTFAVASAVAIAGVTAVVSSVNVTPSCTDAVDGMATVWTPEARAELRESFARSGVAGQATVLADVEAQFDAFTASFSEEHQAACAADDLDLRMACLRRSQAGATALLAILREADAGRVRRAGAALRSLPSPSRCRSPAQVNAPPADPEEAARVAALEPTLARVGSAVAFNEIDRARELLTELEAGAADVTHRPFLAQLWRVQGGVARHEADYERAADRLDASYFAATELGDADLAFKTAIGRGDVCAQLRDPACARDWLAHARSAAVQLGTGPEEETLLSLLESTSFLAEGRYEEGLQAAENAYAVASTGPQELRGDLPAIRNRIALALDGLGRFREAIVWYERDVADLSAIDPQHPGLYNTLANLTLDLLEVGEVERARATGDRALALSTGLFGPDHEYTGHAHQNLGAVAAASGDWSVVGKHMRRAADCFRAARQDHPDLARAESNLGVVATHQGDPPEVALRHHREAVRIATANEGAEHPYTALFRANAGEAYLHAGDPEQAHRELTAALAVFEKVWPADHPTLAVPLANLGEALTKLGRTDEGLTALRRALQIAEAKELRTDHLTPIRIQLADALWAAGEDRPRALQLLREARAGRVELDQAQKVRELDARIAAWSAKLED